ncbi:MAG: FAD-dependent oxidoreductase, partial [Deltaproteobacteria bacterium]|nr:FAD-dependent oxidoreductase [Deltaproteobacteria bacterium]
GVSYCATCDGPFFRGQDVLVVGGGDTAVKEAVYLAKIANKVSVVHRRDKLRAEKILQERLLKAENITVHWDSVLREIKGESGVESAVIENVKTSEKTELKVHGAFMFVGINPTTDLTDAKKNDSGFIITNEKMETSIPGVYAVGDCRNTPLLQVATAVGDGAIAAYIAESYVEGFDD